MRKLNFRSFIQLSDTLSIELIKTYSKIPNLTEIVYLNGHEKHVCHTSVRHISLMKGQ